VNIIEALQNKDNRLRVSAGTRWLVWDETQARWTVYERREFARRTDVVCETTDEDKAVDALIGDDE
jgi:hypothetical protein